jgi:hypothetical protein
MNPKLDQKPYQTRTTESGNEPLSENLPPIYDYSTPLAMIQIHTWWLIEHPSTDWMKLPLMECFADVPCRYTMSIDDYWNLAEQLEEECRKQNNG